MNSSGKQLHASLLCLLLLAGCGSGSDSSSGADPKSLAAENDPSATAGPPTDTSTTRSSKAIVDGAGISAQLIAELLQHNTTGNGWVDEFYAFPAYPWNGPGPGGAVNTSALARTPVLYGGQVFAPVEPGHKTHFVFRFGSWYGLDQGAPAFDFTSADTRIDLTMPAGGYYYPSPMGLQFAAQFRPLPEGSTLITIGTSASVGTRSGRYDPAAQPSAQVQLTAEQARVLKVGDRIPHGQALQTWRDANGNTVTLKVLAGADKTQFRLCLDHQLSTLKRLSCTLWQLPSHVNPNAFDPDQAQIDGVRYRGLHVTDDRSALPGQSGQLYWQSTYDYPRTPTAPITRHTVRGDFLAAVLLMNLPRRDEFGPTYPSWNAAPWDSDNPKGNPLPFGIRPPLSGLPTASYPTADNPGYRSSLEVFVDSEHANPSTLPNFSSTKAMLKLQARTGKIYDELWYFDGEDDLLGTYMHAKHMFSAGQQLRLGQRLLTLTNNAEVKIGGQENPISFSDSNRTLSLRYGVPLPKRLVLQRWRNAAGNTVQLQLREGYKDNQFRLCLNLDLPAVKRTQCSIWEAPDPWKLDAAKPLFRGIFVTDDRSAVGESGILHWQTSPDSAERIPEY